MRRTVRALLTLTPLALAPLALTPDCPARRYAVASCILARPAHVHRLDVLMSKEVFA